ncbi:3-hydroxyacyl-ACP dehydratase FabZ family protein [Streptosporangium sp. NPDC001559]|uniref:3-hydroxyacyl-ACP dehydratase FabZ family protein n=1 Tax=Streptosporangium sp. NPDC001559 TaxID=3366187 RepID=UPI0036E056A8
MIGVGELKKILPHRYPILLIDRVTELVPGERLTALKAVTCNEPWYRTMPPDAGEEAHDYPGVLLVESWCQAAAVLGGRSAGTLRTQAGQVPLLGGVSDVRLSGHARPGDVVEHRVRLVRDFGDTLIFEGESTVAGRLIAEIGRATMALRPGTDMGRASQGRPAAP